MKTGIILSARKEKDSPIPYPMMPLDDGSCLLDRTIANLTELGFVRIILVVGYRSELFERYRSDTVIIVRNPEYEHTGSMGSLALVEPYVDEDFLLIEGDVFYEKKVLSELTVCHFSTCLSLTEESGNGDEAFVETKNGFVTKISKDPHSIVRFDGEMLGLSKIGIDTFRRMMTLWRKSTNPYVNYEYVLFDVTEAVDRPFILFKNLIWGDVDNRENFNRLLNDSVLRLRRKENPYDILNLRNHLGLIFPGENTFNDAIEQIGGMSNKNFKVIHNCKEYVLRIPGVGSEGMVERANESRNSMLTSRIGISPNVRYIDVKTGVKLTEFIPNAETLNSATIQRQYHLKQIAKIFRKLHNSALRLNNDFNVFHEIDKYEQLRLACGAKMYEGYSVVTPILENLDNRLTNLGIEIKPCHNDLVAENFIKDGNGRIYLIDWEYSGMNDPMCDLAAFFLESNVTEENQSYLLKKYFDEDNISSVVWEKIAIYQILLDILWSIWTMIKESQGDDFGNYGTMRFNRAISNYNKLINEKQGKTD